MADWEIISGRSNSFGMEKIGDNEVSIVNSKSGANKPNFRICMARGHFPKEAVSVIVMMDKEKKRIGFFRVDKGQEFQAKRLSSFGKSQKDKTYISMPRRISEMGFEKARYQILKLKNPPENMYFYITADKKTEKKEEPTKE